LSVGCSPFSIAAAEEGRELGGDSVGGGGGGGGRYRAEGRERGRALVRVRTVGDEGEVRT